MMIMWPLPLSKLSVRFSSLLLSIQPSQFLLFLFLLYRNQLGAVKCNKITYRVVRCIGTKCSRVRLLPTVTLMQSSR
ncbi:hypothetical protein BD779DRAFT_1546660 [Infundibulicybe gibba]|nr:hypothetical protein BD779DRAFT_1546660 [Infundibulicybe gibba]